MARVTVEKCKDKTNSNYELVVLAAHRAKDINSGGVLTVERDNDKDSVLALREIEAGYVKIDDLRERFINSLRSSANIEVAPEDSADKSSVDEADSSGLEIDVSEYDFSEEELGDDFEIMFEDDDNLEDEE